MRRTSAAAASSRCPAMRSRARPAILGADGDAELASGRAASETATATSPTPTLVSMPCASSRPRTTSASMEECVRNTSTGGRCFDTGRPVQQPPRPRSPVHLQHDHRHVVVRLGVADEGADFAHDALADAGGVEVVLADDDAARAPRRRKQIARLVHRLGDAVGVEHDRRRPAAIGRVCSSRTSSNLSAAPGRRSPSTMPEGVITSLSPPDTTIERRVAGARARQRARVEVDDGVGHRDEAAVVEVRRRAGGSLR